MNTTTITKKILTFTIVLIASFVVLAGFAHAQSTSDSGSTAGIIGTALAKASSALGITSGLTWLLTATLDAIKSGFVILMLKFAELFGYSVKTFATIEGFNMLYSYVSGPIATLWTFIRDLANILIIGLFVFIAISIILGLSEFGQKKLIARVLIVAILINFSFLFTRIIINASNAFASNIYASLVTRVGGNSVADKYERLLNLASVTNSQVAASKVANEDASGKIKLSIVSFISSMLFSISAILLFLYGTFLLMFRFVILVMALVLSSLAFASYLLPNWSAAIWSRWWETLLKNAILGPIMMIFLWGSITISEQISSQMLANKDLNSLEPSVLTGFVLVLGTLYMGMYIASSFSTQVAQRVAINGAFSPFTLGGSTIGLVGRQTIGRFAAGRAAANATDAKKANIRGIGLAAAGKENEALAEFQKAEKAGKRAQRYESLSGKKYNPMDTGLMQSLAKTLKVAAGSGKNTQSYSEMIKSREAAANKVASKSNLSKDDLKKVTKEAIDTATDKTRDQMSGVMKAAQDNHAANQQAHANERREAVEKHDAQQRELKQLQAEYENTRRSGQGDMAQQQRLIEDARAKATQASQSIADVDTKWTQRLQESRNKVIEAQNAEREAIKKATSIAEHKVHEAEEVVQKLASQRSGTWLQRAMDPITGDAQKVSKELIKHTLKHHKEENLKSMLAELANKQGENHA